jgi:Family of unknown function (DUF6262)
MKSLTKSQGGQQIGREYVEALKSYLDSVEALPARSGKVSMTAIAEASGVPRQSLYKNDDCKALIDRAVEAKGLVGIEQRRQSDPEKVQLERKMMALEQKNAALVGEVHELRRQLKRYRAVEEMMVQGKRVLP